MALSQFEMIHSLLFCSIHYTTPLNYKNNVEMISVRSLISFYAERVSVDNIVKRLRQRYLNFINSENVL